jgi:hypothetical protein
MSLASTSLWLATTTCTHQIFQSLFFTIFFFSLYISLLSFFHPLRYERSFPVRDRVPIKQFHNPGAPVYIVDGAAGTLEGIDPIVYNVPWR